MRRALALLPVLIAFQAGAPPALAWTWPADGPVLRPFTLGDDPYAGGQHRGIDVAAHPDAPVGSPAAGLVSFAGTVPGGGRAVTVQTSDGYSVTLVHLGSIAVDHGKLVAEGEAIGTIGPTGDPEHAEPYVHLGVRVTSDPNGYLDPLAFLPTREVTPLPPSPPAPAVPAPSAPPDPAQPAPEPVLEPAVQPARPEQAPAAAAPSPPRSVRDSVAARSGPAVRARIPDEPKQVASSPAPSDETPAASAGSPPRRALRFFELRPEPQRQAARTLAVAQPMPTRRSGAVFAAALGVLGGSLALAGLCLALAIRHRQLADAGRAYAPAHVLDERTGFAAEDAGLARAAQEDGLVLHRDLERVALGESEALPDLDGDHDPAEIVQVANDACRRPRCATTSGRFHQVRPRVPSRCERAGTGLGPLTPCVVSRPQFPLSRP
jgi:Peptidase family M23